MANIIIPDKERDFYIHLGRVIKHLRCGRQLTQESAANHMNVTFQQIQKYENGKNRISFFKVLRLCDLYSVPVTYFTDKDVAEMPKLVTPEEGEFLDLIRNLSSAKRSMAREFLINMGGKIKT